MNQKNLRTALGAKGQPQLFCPPENLNITGAMVDDMMRDFAKEHPELRSHDSPTVPVLALLALERTFPCKPQ
jgi:hypothetical protein